MPTPSSSMVIRPAPNVTPLPSSLSAVKPSFVGVVGVRIGTGSISVGSWSNVPGDRVSLRSACSVTRKRGVVRFERMTGG